MYNFDLDIDLKDSSFCKNTIISKANKRLKGFTEEELLAIHNINLAACIDAFNNKVDFNFPKLGTFICNESKITGYAYFDKYLKEQGIDKDTINDIQKKNLLKKSIAKRNLEIRDKENGNLANKLKSQFKNVKSIK